MDEEIAKYLERLKKIENDRSGNFWERVLAVQTKYEAIWAFYKNNMPGCVANCMAEFGDEIDGPQGIYWVGKTPLVFFVGLESYEWAYEHRFSVEKTIAQPLWFCFFQTAYMPGFWNRIYKITRLSIQKDEKDDLWWFELLDYVALSNACKCYDPKHQWNLREKCTKMDYIFKEIDVVNAPVNVFFTKTYGLLASKFSGGQEISDTGIIKYGSSGYSVGNRIKL